MDTGENAVIIEPIIRVIQVELAVVGIAVDVQDATIAVLVQPKTYEKSSAPPLLDAGQENFETDFLKLNRIWDLEKNLILQLFAPSILI